MKKSSDSNKKSASEVKTVQSPSRENKFKKRIQTIFRGFNITSYFESSDDQTVEFEMHINDTRSALSYNHMQKLSRLLGSDKILLETYPESPCDQTYFVMTNFVTVFLTDSSWQEYCNWIKLD